ncbi:hypothetical protein ROS217_23582 [Roseovarius sp. 217]|nr:hypothetical protein ROS217_23582 [Roseovarius sp. 217]
MPILRAVLITRQAISPRLAINIFLNIFRPFLTLRGSPSGGAPDLSWHNKKTTGAGRTDGSV